MEQALARRLQPENPDFPGFPGRPLPETPPGSGSTPARRRRRRSQGRAGGRRLEPARAAGRPRLRGLQHGGDEEVVANSAGHLRLPAGTAARLLTVVAGDTSSADTAGAGGRTSTPSTAPGRPRGSAPERGATPRTWSQASTTWCWSRTPWTRCWASWPTTGCKGGPAGGDELPTGKLGQRLLSEPISLWDDPLDPAGDVDRFDSEGVPKGPLVLFEAGWCGPSPTTPLPPPRGRDAVHGHAQRGANYYGPVPLNLLMANPEAPHREAMIGKINRGVLVTRFWYTRAVHPLR